MTRQLTTDEKIDALFVERIDNLERSALSKKASWKIRKPKEQ